MVERARQEPVTTENRELLPQFYEAAREPGQRARFIADRVPIEPADFVVLRIGIVVALLRARELVPGQNHRCALREQKCGQKIPHLSEADAADFGVVSWSLDTVVAGKIVRVAVLIVLAIRFVVLLV